MALVLMCQKCIGSDKLMAKVELVGNLAEIRALSLSIGGKRDDTLETADRNLIENLDLVSGCATITLEAAQESMLGMGLSEWLAEVYCQYFGNYRKGVSDYTTNTVEKLIGRPPRSIETFARDFAQYFGQP